MSRIVTAGGVGLGRLMPAFSWRVVRPLLLPVVFAAGVLLVWECACRWVPVSPLILAPPSAIWAILVDSWPILLSQCWPTLINSVVGFLIAAFCGIAIGMGLVASRRVEMATWPYLLTFQLIPKVALAPLFIIWFGVGPSSRLMFAVFLSFFPITLSAATGFRSADAGALRLCRSLTASSWQSFISVRLPYAMPHIFAGLKVGVTVAMIGVIVGEFVTAQEGLGYIIMFASSAAETALVFAAIFLLCVLGLGLYGLVAVAEWAVRRRLGYGV
jgi:NitT/TauT family transport system permease protein